jgi:hypothetical protein
MRYFAPTQDFVVTIFGAGNKISGQSIELLLLQKQSYLSQKFSLIGGWRKEAIHVIAGKQQRAKKDHVLPCFGKSNVTRNDFHERR